MTASARAAGTIFILVILFVLWYVIAFNYGDGVAFGTYHLSQSGETSVLGVYAGGEDRAQSTLILEPDHTFKQTVRHLADVKHANGTWTTSQNGDIVFSRNFLKTSGEPIKQDEMASAWAPKGSNLQIQIAATSKSGAPTFRKEQFTW